MTETAISLVQLPIIEERLRELADGIDKRVREALSLAVTEDTVKTVKTVRADLNREFKELESQRKELKAKILAPYDRFMETYTECVSVRYEEADAELKRKISAVDDALKREKIEDLKGYFRELADSEGLGWLEYERGGFNVTLSKSRTALHKEADAFVSRVASDVTAVNAMPDSEEILVEYKRSLRLGEAVDIVSRRRKAVEQEKREREHLAEMRKREEEAAERAREAARANPVFSAPKKMEAAANEEEKLKLTFTVTDTRERLKLLKAFLDGNNYQYQ